MSIYSLTVYSLICVWTTASCQAGSPLYLWDYENLTSQSDAIVIASVEGTRRVERQGESPRGLVSLKTSAKVASVLKGDAKNSFLLFHHDLDRNVGTVTRSPMLVFDKPNLDSRGMPTTSDEPSKTAFYLMFLRSIDGSDSEFMLTSGPRKEVLSVKFLDYKHARRKSNGSGNQMGQRKSNGSGLFDE